jgi:NTP pyrophosphatase (non-canonical NTP hydrolase)
MDDSYCVIALNEEAGEIAGWYKKYKLRGNPGNRFTKEDLLSELGDVLYYVTRLADNYGWDINDIMEFNVRKLAERRAKEKQLV